MLAHLDKHCFGGGEGDLPRKKSTNAVDEKPEEIAKRRKNDNGDNAHGDNDVLVSNN